MTDAVKPTIAKAAKPLIDLDWSRLLGFDQAMSSHDAASETRLNDPRLVKLGAKVGNKPGMGARLL